MSVPTIMNRAVKMLVYSSHQALNMRIGHSKNRRRTSVEYTPMREQ